MAFGKFFGYPPDTPYFLRLLARLFAVIAAMGLLGLLSGFVLLFYADSAEEINTFLFVAGYGAVSLVFGTMLSYGIAHVKKWALYIYGTVILASFFAVFWQREFGGSTIVLLIVAAILWKYRKEFR